MRTCGRRARGKKREREREGRREGEKVWTAVRAAVVRF
jgi:hypothetical protein